MNVDLELYKIFYVVAKNKHMTKASEELFISQPAISQSIKKLESQLGGTLFLRSNKGMELTEEGKMFYGYIHDALELISNAEAEFTSFKDLSKGEIKIGASTTLNCSSDRLLIHMLLSLIHSLYYLFRLSRRSVFVTDNECVIHSFRSSGIVTACSRIRTVPAGGITAVAGKKINSGIRLT